MKNREAALEILERMQGEFPAGFDTELLLAEGHFLLLADAARGAHHAGRAIHFAGEDGLDDPARLSRAHALLARTLLAQEDLNGAFGAWQACQLPEWRVAAELIEAGYDILRVREVLEDALPRHQAHERELGADGVAATDQIRRLLGWIDSHSPQRG